MPPADVPDTMSTTKRVRTGAATSPPSAGAPRPSRWPSARYAISLPSSSASSRYTRSSGSARSPSCAYRLAGAVERTSRYSSCATPLM